MIKRVWAWIEFDDPVDDQEEAIQTLIEALGDDTANLRVDHPEFDNEREEWRALQDSTTLHMIPVEAHIASVKYLAGRLLEVTGG